MFSNFMINDLYENDLMSESCAQLLVNTEAATRRCFAKKHLYQSLSFDKVDGCRLVILLKKSLRIMCSMTFVKFFWAPFRSSHRKCFMKIGVLKNLAKFTEKDLRQGLSFNKFAGLACNLIKKETLALVFFYEFC